MSSGIALPSISEVMTQVNFPADPFAVTFPQGVVEGAAREAAGSAGSAAGNIGVPDVLREAAGSAGTVPGSIGVPDVLPEFSVTDAAGQAVDSAVDQLQDLLVPALIGLGSLSGALLAGRAAMAGAQVLATAAIRAAQAQDALREQRLDAQRSAACWRDAAFAAAQVNARLDVLRARIARAGAAAGPGGPRPPGLPGAPDLPPPLAPAGLRLEEMWRRLADTEGRLRRAEAAWARAAMDGAGAAEGTAGASAWHTRLRARRREALAEYERTGSPPAPADPVPARPAAGAGPSGEEVLRIGAELLAGLPHTVSPADHRLVEETIAAAAEVAAERPAAAKRHLREATRFADRAARAAERRQRDQEWAARKLAFLRHTPPGAGLPLPDAGAEIAALERALAEGTALSESETARVSARVGERTAVFQRLYTGEVIRTAVREVGAEHSAGSAERAIDWTPPGWGDEHWLRVLVDGSGSARVITMHRDRTATGETEADRELDRLRCAEAPARLSALEEVAERSGLRLRFTFEPAPEHPTAGAADGATEHTLPPPQRRADPRTGPRARHHDGGPRR
ncbi:hypothetical protein [Streptomyces sp. NPDC001889]